MHRNRNPLHSCRAGSVPERQSMASDAHTPINQLGRAKARAAKMAAAKDMPILTRAHLASRSNSPQAITASPVPSSARAVQKHFIGTVTSLPAIGNSALHTGNIHRGRLISNNPKPAQSKLLIILFVISTGRIRRTIWARW